MLKDFAKNISYTIFLPVLFFLIIVSGYYIIKSKSVFTKAVSFLSSLLIIVLIVEAGIFIYKIVNPVSPDFGDQNHSSIKNIQLHTVGKQPLIFWIIFDEYSASSVLKKTGILKIRWIALYVQEAFL